MRRTAISVAIALLSAGGCSRCDRRSGPAVHVVARSLGDATTLAMLEDGTVYLDTGVYAYRVPDDGPIELVGDRGSYVPFLPAEDGTPVLRARARSFFGTSEAPMMIEGGEAYALKDRVWTKTKARVAATMKSPLRMRGVRRDASTAVPPPDVRALPRIMRATYRRYPNGLFVGLGREYAVAGTSPPPLGLVIRPGSREEVAVPVPDATDAWTCEQAPSADGKAYADCVAHDPTGDERRLYVLDERTWARVNIPSRDVEAPLAVAKDGAVWMGLADPPRLVVRSPGGRITGVQLAKEPDSLARASYVGRNLQTNLPRPQHHAVGTIDEVVDLAPTAGGSMIVLARELSAEGAVVVMRAGGKDVARPEVVGTEIDQLVEVRNREEPRRWVGHCLAVFVHLRRVTEGAWVEGRLHDKPVTGVVFVDSRDEQESFERVVSGFVERNTTNPAAPPEVTCTLPILDKVSE